MSILKRKKVWFQAMMAGGGVSYDDNFQLWLDELTSLGVNHPAPDFRTILNDFFIGINDDGNFSELDRLWIFAQDESNGAADVDIISLALGSRTNSPTWTNRQGFSFPGTSSFNTNYNPSTDGVNYIQNSASYGVWFHTGADSGATNRTVLQATDGTRVAWLIERGATSLPSSRLNQGATNNDFVSSTGFLSGNSYSVKRTGASAMAQYVNGVSDGTPTTSSNGLPNDTFKLGNIGFNANTSWKIGVIWFGSGNVDHLAMHSRIDTAMSALAALASKALYENMTYALYEDLDNVLYEG